MRLGGWHLEGADAERMEPGFTDAGAVLKPQARAAYCRRLQDLQEDLTEARAFDDPGRIDKLQAVWKLSLQGKLPIKSRMR